MTGPLEGVRVLSIAINLPGPAAVARLASQGASVTTVLPPSGDPLEQFAKAYFEELHEGQRIESVDLKGEQGRARVDSLLADTDVFLTSSRPSALRRLGLDHASVSARHPQVCQVDIVGHPGAGAEVAGHDLTYQARSGLITDGRMPATTVVDLAGAERAAGEAAAALVARARTGRGCRREVALSDVATAMSGPVVHGLTVAGGLLGVASRSTARIPRRTVTWRWQPWSHTSPLGCSRLFRWTPTTSVTRVSPRPSPSAPPCSGSSGPTSETFPSRPS